ncbi:MAG: FadR family transcriptional regulator [Deltaproteobacteria bacterium]|nr:FadR family transcriptional regulator [Deltaproteobacteria bacterium]
MPIQAIGSDRLYRKIAKQLSDLISAGEFAPGQRLPSERELAEQLGVSRPSVREALIALEIEGKVEVRVGSGVFVAVSKPSPLLANEQHGEGPFELISARMIVEGETAAHAASGATADEIEEIRAAVADLQKLQAAGLPTDPADRAFHLSIARATHNGPLASVVELLWDQGRGKMWRQMEKHFQTPALRAATLRDHRAIVDAIAEGDPEAARAAMKKHLSRVAREFTRGWGLLKK